MGTPIDTTFAALAKVAKKEHALFTGKNLRVRRSNTVHAVRHTPWMAGLTLPAPACGQGWSGAGVGDLHPVAEPVSCDNCIGAAAAAAEFLQHQLALPLRLGKLPLPW